MVFKLHSEEIPQGTQRDRVALHTFIPFKASILSFIWLLYWASFQTSIRKKGDCCFKKFRKYGLIKPLITRKRNCGPEQWSGCLKAHRAGARQNSRLPDSHLMLSQMHPTAFPESPHDNVGKWRWFQLKNLKTMLLSFYISRNIILGQSEWWTISRYLIDAYIVNEVPKKNPKKTKKTPQKH